MENGIYNKTVAGVPIFLEGDFYLSSFKSDSFVNDKGETVNYSWVKLTDGYDNFKVVAPNDLGLDGVALRQKYHCYFTVGENDKKLRIVGLYDIKK